MSRRSRTRRRGWRGWGRIPTPNVIGVPSGAFSPISLAPVTWLRFSDYALADDALIATATDLSGNGNDWGQATEALRPTYKTNIVNEQAVARFPALANVFFDGPDLSSLTAGEAFIVIKLTTEDDQGLWDMGSTANGTYFPIGGSILDEFGTDTRKSVGNPALSLTEWRLYNPISTATEWTAFLDGGEIFTTATNTVAFASATLLGKNSDGVIAVCDIAELILFDRKLAAGEKASMEAYFASRYALSIA